MTKVFHEPLLRNIERLTTAANEFAVLLEANPEAFADWHMATGGTAIFLSREVAGVGDAKKLAKAIGGTWRTYRDSTWICDRWPGVEVWITHRDNCGDADDREVSLD